MADKYAPALVLEVLAFWLVLRWLLTGRAVLLVGRALVLMMLVGVLASLDEHHIVWATFFGGAALLAGAMLRRWRGQGFRRPTVRLPSVGAWHGRSAAESPLSASDESDCKWTQPYQPPSRRIRRHYAYLR